MIGDVTVTALTRERAVAAISDAVSGGGTAIFAFCNAHSVNIARRDPAFRRALGDATVFNDGFGLDIATRILGEPRFPDNLNGTDLTPALLDALPAGTPIFLLGSPAGVAEEARLALAARFPALRFVGTEHGWFTAEDEPRIAAKIRASGARLILVGMGQPRQEIWASRHRAGLECVLLCVGAYLDFAAGRFQRAPRWIQAARSEWIWRLALEPRRLAQRYLVGNALFVARMVSQRVGRRSHVGATDRG